MGGEFLEQIRSQCTSEFSVTEDFRCISKRKIYVYYRLSLFSIFHEIVSKIQVKFKI